MAAKNGNGDLIYANGKLSLAVHILATSHGSLQERLLEAWMREGQFALPMGPGQAGKPMSDELVARLRAFNDQMSSRPAKADEGTFAATILTMTDEEASDAAGELMSLAYDVRNELDHP